MSMDNNILLAKARTYAEHNPSSLGAVIKELLHYDIINVLNKLKAFEKGITFQGGTALRLVYGGRRFSEDLDFAAGHDFNPDRVKGLSAELQRYIEHRYQLPCTVKEPKLRGMDGVAVDTWQLAVTTQPEKRDEPQQRIKIEFACVNAITKTLRFIEPAFDAEKSSRTMVLVESAEEIFADKIIAAGNRTYFKARDLFDIKFLSDRQITFDIQHVIQKVDDYHIDMKSFVDRLSAYCELLELTEIGDKWRQEMSRFATAELTPVLNHPAFWPSARRQVQDVIMQAVRQLESYISGNDVKSDKDIFKL
ncbi:nucleotidyl transferase AbiEii/AbiGii toxin family protein [Brenneria sp. WC1b.1]|nr:nucleotidyl transferase AbiEii/AbiGii toxin family protein [Brenneria tiliae]